MAEPKRHRDVPKERVLESLPDSSAVLHIWHSPTGLVPQPLRYFSNSDLKAACTPSRFNIQ